MVTISFSKSELLNISFIMAKYTLLPFSEANTAIGIVGILKKIRKNLPKHIDKQYIESHIELLYMKFPSIRPFKRVKKQ